MDAEPMPTWCPQCGPRVPIDSEGTCMSCGADAMGAGADAALQALADVERLRGIVDAAKVVAYRGEHTGDCIGASGGACFEDDRDECECALTTLRNALKGSE